MKDNEQNDNVFEKSILKAFAVNPFESYNYKQISAKVGAFDKVAKDLVKATIQRMFEQKILIETQRGKFQLNSKYIDDDLLPQNYIVGTVDMKQTGKAYILPEDFEMEDIFIAPNNVKNSLPGDKVKVRLFPKRKGQKPEGQIVEVLQRARLRFVGRIQINEKMAFFIPDHRSIPVDFMIPLDELNGAQNNQKVLVEITEWHERAKSPFAKVVEVLGMPGENNVEMLSILAENDFPLSFPKEVEKEALKIPLAITSDEIAKRKDFRKVTTFTIDPEDAKDFDDAISFRKLENGNVEIGVHIADVSYYVPQDGAIDKEAYNRGTSVYLVDRTVPMLPERLSNEVCSLRPNEEKLCFSAVFEMNEKAEVVQEWFGKTAICSDRRFTYEEAQNVIETGKGDYSKEILAVHKLANILRKERFNDGAINFESREVKFRLDENAKPIGVYIKEQKEANFLIEEFMLLANKKVAEHIGKKEGSKAIKTFVYRVHDEPNPEKLNTFIQFVNKLGYKMKLGSRKKLADSFNNLFVNIEGKGEENMIETIAIRTMAKAFYSTENIGHYGLGFPFYSHFTSPIRRYPDLMVHRLLERYLHKGSSANVQFYEECCKHASLMEKKAADAERTSVKYKQAEYLSERIGQVFLAKISGVSKWGIYAEIEENRCEGMISLSSFVDDYYYLDEDNYQVIGRRFGKKYKLGDPIQIRVLRVDLAKKQMDFEYVDENAPSRPSIKEKPAKNNGNKNRPSSKDKKADKSKKGKTFNGNKKKR